MTRRDATLVVLCAAAAAMMAAVFLAEAWSPRCDLEAADRAPRDGGNDGG